MQRSLHVSLSQCTLGYTSHTSHHQPTAGAHLAHRAAWRFHPHSYPTAGAHAMRATWCSAATYRYWDIVVYNRISLNNEKGAPFAFFR